MPSEATYNLCISATIVGGDDREVLKENHGLSEKQFDNSAPTIDNENTQVSVYPY